MLLCGIPPGAGFTRTLSLQHHKLVRPLQYLVQVCYCKVLMNRAGVRWLPDAASSGLTISSTPRFFGSKQCKQSLSRTRGAKHQHGNAFLAKFKACNTIWNKGDGELHSDLRTKNLGKLGLCFWLIQCLSCSCVAERKFTRLYRFATQCT